MTSIELLIHQLKKEVDILLNKNKSIENELKGAIKDRDELYRLMRKQNLDHLIPESCCRICDSPMEMKYWNEQYCTNCGPLDH